MKLTAQQISKVLGRNIHQFKCWVYQFGDRTSMFQSIASAKAQGYLPYEVDLPSLTVKVLKK